MTIIQTNFDVESPPHKALRLALSTASAQLGQATVLTESLRSHSINTLDLMNWHGDWSRQVIYPVVDGFDPGASASVRNALRRLDEQANKLRGMLSMRTPARQLSHWTNRVYQHWTLMQASAYNLMHQEEAVVQASLNLWADESVLYSLCERFNRSRPPGLALWLKLALPVNEHPFWLNFGEQDA